MFHLIMTINNHVGSFIGNNHYGAQAVLLLSNFTIVDATKNAASYTQLAIAQQAQGRRVSGNLLFGLGLTEVRASIYTC